MTAVAAPLEGPWPYGNFWLRVGWMVDGSGGQARRDQFIQVANGRICLVTSRPPEVLKGPFIDLPNASVMPMMMDAHVHLALSGTRDSRRRQGQLAYKFDNVKRNVTSHLDRHWKYGVSAVREAGDPNGLVLDILRGDLSPREPAVTIAMTRWAWHAPGRYGATLGRSVEAGRDLWDAVATHVNAIDHVKIIQSGINSLDRFGHQTRPQFNEYTLSRMVAKAHEHNLKVMVHANGQAAVHCAVEAGCDTIEHGYFMGAANLQRMAEKSITWVPTVVPMDVLARSRRLTARQRQIARKTVDHQIMQIHQAKGFGVRIGLGTDAGSWGVDHGKAVWEELRLLVCAGLSPEQAISSATSVNRLASWPDNDGTLGPGRSADFTVIAGGPEQLGSHLPRLIAICWQGQWQTHM